MRFLALILSQNVLEIRGEQIWGLHWRREGCHGRERRNGWVCYRKKEFTFPLFFSLSAVLHQLFMEHFLNVLPVSGFEKIFTAHFILVQRLIAGIHQEHHKEARTEKEEEKDSQQKAKIIVPDHWRIGTRGKYYDIVSEKGTLPNLTNLACSSNPVSNKCSNLMFIDQLCFWPGGRLLNWQSDQKLMFKRKLHKKPHICETESSKGH